MPLRITHLFIIFLYMYTSAFTCTLVSSSCFFFTLYNNNKSITSLFWKPELCSFVLACVRFLLNEMVEENCDEVISAAAIRNDKVQMHCPCNHTPMV